MVVAAVAIHLKAGQPERSIGPQAKTRAMDSEATTLRKFSLRSLSDDWADANEVGSLRALAASGLFTLRVVNARKQMRGKFVGKFLRGRSSEA